MHERVPLHCSQLLMNHEYCYIFVLLLGKCMDLSEALPALDIRDTQSRTKRSRQSFVSIHEVFAALLTESLPLIFDICVDIQRRSIS